ncbi:MAG: hypothetical protein AB2L14_18965 [Candidatus Xenobiia bacterium LiM19]
MPPRRRNSLQQHLKDDINRACDAFESFPEAVTFIGSQRLREGSSHKTAG